MGYSENLLFRTYGLWPVSSPKPNEHGQETGSSNRIKPILILMMYDELRMLVWQK